MPRRKKTFKSAYTRESVMRKPTRADVKSRWTVWAHFSTKPKSKSYTPTRRDLFNAMKRAVPSVRWQGDGCGMGSCDVSAEVATCKQARAALVAARKYLGKFKGWKSKFPGALASVKKKLNRSGGLYVIDRFTGRSMYGTVKCPRREKTPPKLPYVKLTLRPGLKPRKWEKGRVSYSLNVDKD